MQERSSTKIYHIHITIYGVNQGKQPKHLFKECSHNLSSHYWHGCALQQKEINVAGNNPPLIRKLSSLDQTHNIKAFLSEMG